MAMNSCILKKKRSQNYNAQKSDINSISYCPARTTRLSNAIPDVPEAILLKHNCYT